VGEEVQRAYPYRPCGKRRRLYILPQFLSNLTRPIKNKVKFFDEDGRGEILHCNSNIAYPRFEVYKVYKTFLCVFMSNFYGFHALRTVGKCTGRHLFSYGGLEVTAQTLPMLSIEIDQAWVRFENAPRLTMMVLLVVSMGPFLGSLDNFSGPKANLSIKTCRIVAQFLGHKQVNLASLINCNFIVSFSELLKLWSWM